MKQESRTHNCQSRPSSGGFKVCLKWFGLALLGASASVLNGCSDSLTSADGIDPGIIEIPVAFIKRPIPLEDVNGMLEEVNVDIRDPLTFMAGGDVYLRTSSAAEAVVTNISRSETLGTGDVKGLNSSHDGTKLIFSLRLFDPDPNDDVVPSWNIFEYDLETEQLRQIITSPLTAEQGDDLYPAYLPDGRIVFTSNRQSQSREMLINEGKDSFAALDEDEDVKALVLHVMNPDGTGIKQISFNQSHDLFPQVMTNYDSGKIAFSRWDNAAGNNEVNIYTINPDGSDLELLYGSQSHNTGTGGATIQFTNFRETRDGDLMVITRPFTGTFDGGDITLIDVTRFANNNKPIWVLSGLAGPAQSRVSVAGVANDGSISVNGRYGTAFPLWDSSNRVLVSKSICQLDVNGVQRPCIDDYLDDPDAEEMSPNFSIWLYDMDEDTEKPIVLAEAGMVITDAITIENRTRANVIFDRELTGALDSDWTTEVKGVVNIRSVYELGDGTFNGCFFGECTGAAGINTVQDFADPLGATADQRPARFVRFTKAVGIPDPDDPLLVNPPDLDGDAFGLQRNRGMREILGYAPVEPDGSVMVKVPANVPMAVEVLDRDGRRLGPRHDNWFQVQPGDTLTCNGCHDSSVNPAEIHARADGEAPSINAGTTGTFVNTVIPGSVPPTAYTGIAGQTMAEVRFATLDALSAPEPELSPDLVYIDHWTDPPLNAGFDYSYGGNGMDVWPEPEAGLHPTTPTPTNAFCSPTVEFNCRVIINYPDHIHAIFQLDRDINGVDDFAPLAPANPLSSDPTNTPLVMDTVNLDGVGDETCISCHTSLAGTRLPYGQLDLTTDPNQDPNARYRSYNQMFLSKPAQFFDGVNLANFDPEVLVAPSMSPNGARASTFVQKMMSTGGSVDHSVMLTGAELRMIKEWLDLGGQNFNDPFDPDAPQN